MLSFAPTLGINSHRLGRQESLATSSRLLLRVSALPALGLMRSTQLAVNAPLLRTSKLLSTRIDRSHIGWDTWNPLDYPHDPSLDIESFNEGIDRSKSGTNRIDREPLLTDERSLNTFDNSASGGSNFFTKILTNESNADNKSDELTMGDRSTPAVPISTKASRSKSKSPAQSKSEKVSTKAKSKSSKLPAKAKSLEILPETIDRIQPSIIPDLPVVNILAASDPIEPTNSESSPDIFTTFVDSYTNNIDPESSLESFVEREQKSLPSDELEIASSLAESPLPRRIDLTPANTLLPDNLSPTLPTIPLELVQTATQNIETNPEIIAATDSHLFDKPAVDAPAISTSTPLLLTQPEFNTTISEPPPQPPLISSPPANDTAAKSGIDKTTAPASSPQLPPDTTILSPVPPLEAEAIVANTKPGIDKTIMLESPAIVTDIFPPTSPHPQLEPTSLESNEPEIAAKTIPEATTPIIPESLPTPPLPSLTIVNDKRSIDNVNIPADSGVLLPAIFPTISAPLPPVESNSIPLNEIESENTITPELTTQLLPNSLPTFSSPSLEVATELTSADNNELRIDSLTIQTSPEAMPDISTQIVPNSTIANESDLATINPEFKTQLLPDNLPTITPQFADLDVKNISTDRDRINIDLTTISEFTDPILTDVSVRISPIERNLIATSNLEIVSKNPPEPSQDFQQLNLPSVLPIQTRLSPDNIDIDRITTPASIDDNLSIDPTAPVDTISPAVSNEFTEITNLVSHQNLETLPNNLQIDRDLSIDRIELDEPILPNNYLIKPVLNIEPQPEIDRSIPVRGYATGGHVKSADKAKKESIASSDTVAAMLTPGEFVINAKDAQKNLNLLTHINTGGEAETIATLVPELSTQSHLTASTTPLTKPTASIYQHQYRESLISPSLQPDLDRHQISFLNRSPLDNAETSQTDLDRSVPNYISPSLIFRKPQSPDRTDFSRFEPPDEWNSIEELMNGGSYGAEPFSFSSDGAQNLNEDRSSTSSSPLNISPKYSSPILGFANGGQVPLPDIAPKIEPITQTIAAETPDEGGSKNSDSAELETLAREIYYRLRQRLEIERERQGIYSGLAW